MILPRHYSPKFDYHSLSKEEVDGKRLYLTPDGNRLPSVTTILSSTADKSGLIAWRKRIGNEEANRITQEAANIGTKLHSRLESHLKGEKEQEPRDLNDAKSRVLANNVIGNALSDVSEVWGLEVSLFMPELYAGTTDVVGLWKGRPAIIDFKNSRKPKKEEWILDYKCQIAAYGLCHNHHFGDLIEGGVIIIQCRTGELQIFELFENKYEEAKLAWINRLDRFYS